MIKLGKQLILITLLIHNRLNSLSLINLIGFIIKRFAKD